MCPGRNNKLCYNKYLSLCITVTSHFSICLEFYFLPLPIFYCKVSMHIHVFHINNQKTPLLSCREKQVKNVLEEIKCRAPD